MSPVEDSISQVPLFAKLSRRDLKRIAASMKERVFHAGTIITEQGQSGIGFFVIDSGQATVSSGGRTRATLKSGDFFGEIALLDGGTRTAQVVADTDLRCYCLSEWEFRPLVQTNPDVAWPLLKTMAQRLREAEARAGGE